MKSNEITKCRICGNRVSDSSINLGELALTGIFVEDGKSVARESITLVHCSNNECGLLQLKQVYDLNILYGQNYGYSSSLNSSMVKHLQKRAKNLIERFEITSQDLVLDIGSNDATSLQQFPSVDIKIGVDAVGYKFQKKYEEIKAELIVDFFPSKMLDDLLGTRKVKLISSYSCFYDLPDPVGFAKSISRHLADDGVWVLEQSYMPAMLETLSFDTICHEHIEYYCLKDIDNICKRSGLRLIDVEFNDINGGSFVAYVVTETSKRYASKSVDKVLRAEKEIDWSIKYSEFSKEILETRSNLRNLLTKLKEQGKTLYGLGASTKGNVLLQYFNIGTELISEIGEVNPEKFGMETPGSGIPIVSEASLLSKRPEYLLVLPWHFREFFLSSQKLKGSKLIFPMPTIEVIELH